MMFCFSTLIGTSIVAIDRAEAWSYYIDESTDFTGNGCENHNVNTVTSSLKSALNADFHTGGWRFVNADAYPQDFYEACYVAGGHDDTEADSELLAVYAGHGSWGRISFGYARYNKCHADLDVNVKLGSMSGNKAGYAMYITSCTLRLDKIVDTANQQWLRQQFGFHNSPSVQSGSPAAFYIKQMYFSNPDTEFPTIVSNNLTWLDTMEFDIDGDEDNSPVVVTHGTSQANATTVLTGC
jgi:hypothetical protein